MVLRDRRISIHGTAAVLIAALTGLGTAGAAWGAPSSAGRAAQTRTCSVNDLYVSMGTQHGAAGSVYWPIRFTNTSTSDCALRGFPGVSVLNTEHHQIGSAASRNNHSHSTVTLAPGHGASAVVRTASGPMGKSCEPTGTYLRIYPPASYDPVLVPARYQVCAGVFEVGPVNTHGTF